MASPLWVDIFSLTVVVTCPGPDLKVVTVLCDKELPREAIGFVFPSRDPLVFCKTEVSGHHACSAWLPMQAPLMSKPSYAAQVVPASLCSTTIYV